MFFQSPTPQKNAIEKGKFQKRVICRAQGMTDGLEVFSNLNDFMVKKTNRKGPLLAYDKNRSIKILYDRMD